jgi:hypothetical protein
LYDLYEKWEKIWESLLIFWPTKTFWGQQKVGLLCVTSITYLLFNALNCHHQYNYVIPFNEFHFNEIVFQSN